MKAEQLPGFLSINAYADALPKPAPLHEKGARWILRTMPPAIRPFLSPKPLNLADWRDSRVGWGIILPDDDGLSKQDRANLVDAPEPIRALAEARDAPVFRYRSDDGMRYLRDYKRDVKLSTLSSPLGTKTGCLPYYLLICGNPETIPWRFQYVLNGERAVGRLALKGDALERYVRALLHEWDGRGAEPSSSLVWSVVHDIDDITGLVNATLADPLQIAYANDTDIVDKAYFKGASATIDALLSSLEQCGPSVVVTTSHGATHPLDDAMKLSSNLGAPVDYDYQLLRPEVLLDRWQPRGAMWYAHACCSAGADDSSFFEGLVAEGSQVEKILRGIASGGAKIAPLPTALLSAERPLKAFIGHVEPTFDWSLREPQTRQPFGDRFVKALYDRLFSGEPIGHAMRSVYQQLATIYAVHDDHVRTYNREGGTMNAVLRDLLVAHDVQSSVILGDPSVTLR